MPVDCTTQRIEGWTVHVRNRLLKEKPNETRVALKLLKTQLQYVVQKLPKNAVAHLKTVAIFLSPDYPGLPLGGEYHPSEKWLRDNGRDPEMARCVEFHNINIFPAEVRRMPVLVIHELAHAYHHQVLTYENTDVLDAFNRAMAAHAYDSVQRSDGQQVRAYAATNVYEFYAETSEAFFGRNDFFPYNRTDLERYDPNTAAMQKRTWNR
jgi:hypothetical protein